MGRVDLVAVDLVPAVAELVGLQGAVRQGDLKGAVADAVPEVEALAARPVGQRVRADRGPSVHAGRNEF